MPQDRMENKDHQGQKEKKGRMVLMADLDHQVSVVAIEIDIVVKSVAPLQRGVV